MSVDCWGGFVSVMDGGRGGLGVGVEVGGVGWGSRDALVRFRSEPLEQVLKASQ